MHFGDPGGIARRMMLFSKLAEAQQKEFRDVFDMVDVKKSGMVSLLEMRKFMTTAGEQKSDEELLAMIKSAGNSQLYHKCSEDAVITRNEFLGVMAEAEFYNLFTETFEELDKEKTGYVRAGDLAAILGGVQDLLGVGGAQVQANMNIIDTEDSDMLVDYEQFSKMLLGAPL
jgi:calmodulin